MAGTIAAVVVTFNRKKLLLECLNALKNQSYPPDAIFIIDGPSKDGTPEALLEEGYITELPPKDYVRFSWETVNFIESPVTGRRIKIHYVRLYKDVGGAGGFHEGVKRAYAEGYDWIWLMDDDAEPKKDALEKLLRYVNLEDAVALAQAVISPTGEIAYHARRISMDPSNPLKLVFLDKRFYQRKDPVEIDFAAFVGVLVKREVVSLIGFPRKEFFLYWDDNEYSIRLRQKGKIYLIPESIIIHKGELKAKNLIAKKFGKRIVYRLPYNRLFGYYFLLRNGIYLNLYYSKNRLGYIASLMWSWIRHILGVLVFDDHKFRRIMLITVAYIDGLRGVFDNEKPKRILYGERS